LEHDLFGKPVPTFPDHALGKLVSSSHHKFQATPRGKPEGGAADCVLKTSPELFTRIVREAYVPGPADFLSGAFKSNDVALLMTFQRVFQLDERS